MVGNDPKNVFIDNWSAAICTIPNTGNVNYIQNKPVETVNYGLIFSRALTNRAPLNMNAPYGLHQFTIYIIGKNLDEIDNFIKQIVQVCDDPTHFTSNTLYGQFLADVNNVQHLDNWKEHPINLSLKRIAVLDIACPLLYDTSHRLGDPRYTNNVGETK